MHSATNFTCISVAISTTCTTSWTDMSALPTVGTHPAGLGPEEALSSLGIRVTSLLPVLASLGMRLISSAAAFGGIAPATN